MAYGYEWTVPDKREDGTEVWGGRTREELLEIAPARLPDLRAYVIVQDHSPIALDQTGRKKHFLTVREQIENWRRVYKDKIMGFRICIYAGSAQEEDPKEV